MEFRGRHFNLRIWGLAFGYFAFYIPYSAAIKALTSGMLPNVGEPPSGFRILPVVVMATAVTMLLIITVMGWWKHATRREVFSVRLPCPSPLLFLSGLGTAIIIGATTLAYSFKGISILFALLLLRGGVLMIAPFVDLAFKRRVRWFSWSALALSFAAIVIVLLDVNNYRMTTVAALNTCAYLAGYVLRLPCMTHVAKSREKDADYRYFVDEQIVALPLLVLIPAVLALVGQGAIMSDLRAGFTGITFGGADGLAATVGAFYAALCVFGTLIYLDRRENTFCIPLNRCASVLSILVAAYALTYIFGVPLPSVLQHVGALLVVGALLFLSPLHHGRIRYDQSRTFLLRLRIQFKESVNAAAPLAPEIAPAASLQTAATEHNGNGNGKRGA